MRYLLLALLGLAAVGAGLLYAETGGMSKRTVWIVPYDCQDTLQVQPGDVIEVWTRNLPVVPDNLESRFRASKVGPGVEFIGDALPHKEGTMQRLFFFKAFDPGPATLKVELVSMDGSVRESWSYQVQVLQPACQP